MPDSFLALRKVTEPTRKHRYQALSEFMIDLYQPNQAHLLAVKRAPLIERNPLLFWKLLAGALLLANIIQIQF